MNNTIPLLQQRDFGAKVNASFDFAKQNFSPLVKTLVFIAGPPAVFAGIGQGIVQSNILGVAQNPNIFAQFDQYLTPGFAITMFFSVIAYFMANSSVCAFMTLYEERGSSEDITPGAVWEKIGVNLSASLIATVLSFLATLVGFVFFVIPGIYLSVALQFFMMITIREGLSAGDSLNRSRKLIQDKWWSTFGLLIVMSFIAQIIGIVFQVPTMISTILSTLGLADNISNMKALVIGGSVLSIFGSTIVQGLIWVALAFQYYNLVERTDGSSLKAEIDQLGKGDWERPVSEGF